MLCVCVHTEKVGGSNWPIIGSSTLFQGRWTVRWRWRAEMRRGEGWVGTEYISSPDEQSRGLKGWGRPADESLAWNRWPRTRILGWWWGRSIGMTEWWRILLVKPSKAWTHLSDTRWISRFLRYCDPWTGNVNNSGEVSLLSQMFRYWGSRQAMNKEDSDCCR